MEKMRYYVPTWYLNTYLVMFAVIYAFKNCHKLNMCPFIFKKKMVYTTCLVFCTFGMWQLI